jgi:hypothetical protein
MCETTSLLHSAPGTSSKRRVAADDDSEDATIIGLSDYVRAQHPTISYIVIYSRVITSPPLAAHPTFSSRAQAGRLMYAPSCGLFYASLLLASLTEIIWISHPWINPTHCCRLFYPKSRVFFAVEAYLTLGLVAETSLTLVHQRRAFFRSFMNWFDLVVCGSSLLSFGLYWSGGPTAVLDEAILLVMVGWVALRLARLVIVVRRLLRERRRRNFAAQLDIAFPDEDGRESEDGYYEDEQLNAHEGTQLGHMEIGGHALGNCPRI